MSGTFTAPSGPTTGLQRYNLEGGVKQLYPTLWRARSSIHARLAALKRRRGDQRALLGKPGLSKGQEQMNAFTTEDRLWKLLGDSTSRILAAGGDIGGNLSRTHEEFRAELEKSIGASDLAKRITPEEPLYKGLPLISRLSQSLQHLSSSCTNMKAGKDWEHQDDKHASDPADDDVMALMNHAVHAHALALRAAVNKHVALANHDDMDAPDMTLIHIPDPDAEDDETKGLIVKMVGKVPLTEDLAKNFLTHPVQFERDLIDLGLEMMSLAGYTDEQLAKLFDPAAMEQLSKLAPPDPDDNGGTPDSIQPGDEGSDGLDVIGRLAAAIIITIEHLRGAGGGAAAVTDPTAGAADDTNPAAGPATGASPSDTPANNEPPTGAGQDDPTKKKANPFAKGVEIDDLQKLIDASPAMQGLRGQVKELTDLLGKSTNLLTKMAAQPRPAPEGAVLQPPVTREAVGAVSTVRNATGIVLAAGGSAADVAAQAEEQTLNKLNDPTGARKTELSLKKILRQPGQDVVAFGGGASG
ncbi:MAG: hypothetical protein WDN04_13870 [Rhodospirillales bacterium]